MQTDSDIIYFTTRSLSIDSQSQSRRSLSSSQTGGADITTNTNPSVPATKSAAANNSSKRKKSNNFKDDITCCDKLRHECKTFWCFVCFLTCKSFKYHSPKMYLLILIMMILASGMISGGFMSAILTSLQTQFNLSTSKVGLILSSFDIMNVFATPLVSYIGSRYNKARLIAICAFFYVLGTVIFILPQILSNKYTPRSVVSSSSSANSTFSQYDFCTPPNATALFPSFDDLNTTTPTPATTSWMTTSSSNSTSGSSTTTCNRNASAIWPYYVFILGQIFMSLGSSPIFSLGITYLCDNLEERLHAFYTGIIYGAFALGPAIGYLTASFLLSKWVNPTDTAPVDENSPYWVGCWWVGFICSGALMLIFALLMISFPETLTRTGASLKEQKRLRKIQTNEKFTAYMSSKSSSPSTKTSSSSGGGGGGSRSESTTPKDQASLKQQRLTTIAETIEMDLDPGRLDSVSSRHCSSCGCGRGSPGCLHSAATSASSIGAGVGTSATNSEAGSVTVPADATCGQKALNRLKYVLFKLKGFVKSFFKLMLNFRYTLLVIILSIECILVATFTNYMILYSQNIYQLSSSRASIIVGGVIVPSAIIGAILGGFIVRKFDFYIEGCTRMIILGSVVVIAGVFVLLFIRCDGPASTGIDLAHQSFNTTFMSCNKGCDCGSVYNPVCGADSVTYVSPCYAGCPPASSAPFYNCSCINMGLSGNDTGAHSVTAGACSRNCSTKFIIFLIILFLVIAAESLCLTPATMLLLKLVDKPLQPFALGVMKCFNILLAFIPTPIILSQLIDNTCILWNNQCVGDKGTCLEYNASTFHYTLFGAGAVVKVASCILLVIFSIHIHKAYVLKRRYRSHARLNHDVTSVLSPKQKYRIDAIVASNETSFSDTSSNRSILPGKLHKSKKQRQDSGDKSGEKEKKPEDCGVVLRQHVMYDDNCSILGSQNFTNLEALDREIQLDDERLAREPQTSTPRGSKASSPKVRVRASQKPRLSAIDSVDAKTDDDRDVVVGAATGDEAAFDEQPSPIAPNAATTAHEYEAINEEEDLSTHV